MKKRKIAITLLTTLLLSSVSSTAFACTGFIIGKDLTEDGHALFGRTEDLEPNHNKTFVVHEAKENKNGAELVDQSNKFTYPLPKQSYKYTAVPDVTPEYGVYDEAGFNEFGVSMSATVSASANDSILKLDPYVEDGLAESSMTTLILPHVKTAREGIEMIAKVVTEKGSAEGNIVVLADKEGIWYMEILSGHEYVAIKFPDDKFAVFPNTFYLGHVNFEDKENTIASPKVEELARKANTYKEVDGKFHIAQSYNPELADGNRSRSYSGIKSLDPDSKVTYEDEYYELLQSTDKKFTLEDAIALQRNRFEGLDLKPLDQMELDGKGKPDGKKAVEGYAYPISNPNVMEAHIFQLKENVPAELGGGVMWLSVGSPRYAPYLPYYGNITDTYEAYQDTSVKYNKDSWYWTVSRINNMVSKNPSKYEADVLKDIKAWETEWIKEVSEDEAKYVKLFETDPAKAAEETTNDSKERAEETFKKLKAIEKKIAKQVKKDKKAKKAKN